MIANKKVRKNTTLYAPRNGYIFEKNINSGSAFNAKEKLFELVDLNSVWVEVKVFDEDMPWLSEAQSFEVSFKITDRVYKTNSFTLYPKINPDETSITLRLHLRNRDNKLFPGMYTSVLASSFKSEKLTLPRSAVIRKNAKYYVFVSSEFKGEYEPQEVKVETINSEIYIINDGLKEGEKVVNNALFMMDSDAQINGVY